MKKLLTKKNEVILVDDEDYDIVKEFTWYVSSTGYVVASRKGENYTLARLLLGIQSGTRIFYINGNKLDNRRVNLRLNVVVNIYPEPGILQIHTGERIVIVLFDVDDTDLVKRYTWSVTDRGYVRAKIRGKNTSMHRFILGLTEVDEGVVDHLDRNQLNNRRSNLRHTTQTENNLNRKVDCRNTSGVAGVFRSSDGKNWTAKFKYAGNVRQKRFSIAKYGDQEAFRMAVEYRRQVEQELKRSETIPEGSTSEA